MTTQLDDTHLPPRPKPGADPAQWLADLKAWSEHPEVVAYRSEQARREDARIESLRPRLECSACQLQRLEDPDQPWLVVECGPHRVDTLMARAGRMGYRPVPKRYAHANPDDLIPALRSWDGTRGLYLTGPVGTGKTYQAAALVRLRFRTFDPPLDASYYGPHAGTLRGTPVVWRNVPQLLEEVRRSFDAPDTAPEGLEHAPLLVLDDIGAEKPSEWVEERLYCIINERYESGLPIIVTSNLTPSQLGQRVGARLTSRLREMCDVHGLGGKDRRLERAA